MNNDEKASNGSDAGAQQRQGIFSTPDLTVDPSNIAVPTPEQKQNDRSRVMTAFSQRNLERRQALGEPVQASIIESTQTRPRREASGRSKLPILIAAGVLVILVVVGVAVAMVGRGGGRVSVTPMDAFDTFRNELIKGPENIPEDEKSGFDGWFLFNASEIDWSNEDELAYYKKLNDDYDVFMKTLDNSNGETKETAEVYGSAVKAYTNYASAFIYAENVKKAFLEGGSEKAKELIREYVGEVGEHEEGEVEDEAYYDVSLIVLNQYLNAKLEVLELANAGGCVKDEILDYECFGEMLSVNKTIDEVISKSNSYAKMILNNQPLVQGIISGSLTDIPNLIRSNS